MVPIRRPSPLNCVALSLVSACLALSLAACGGSLEGSLAPSGTPGAVPAPTTTLQAQTGNNTSAADTFTQQTDGNVGSGNVSKLSLQSLLPAGSNAKIYVTLMGWFGKPDHMDVGYSSDDPAQIHRQVEDMISRGIQGAIMPWYGQANTVIDTATQLLRNEAENQGGQFGFAIRENQAALTAAAQANGCDVTDQLIADLTYVASQYESSPAYMHVNGRPVVFFFGVDAYYIDWSRVISSIPGNPLLVFEGTDGLTRKLSDGGFSWIQIKSNNPFDPQLAAQDSFYEAAQKATGRLAFGVLYKGFNDTLASWGTDRVIQQTCGQTWLQNFSEEAKYYSGSNQLSGIQIATWNDYEEGTAIEPGIDNCVYLTPSQSGTKISWGVNGGDESTVDHYTVYVSTDGTNLSKLADVPAGTHSIDLSQWNLSQTVYSVYVQAAGKPSIRNKMSPAIAYRPGDQPPGIQLKVSQTGTLTYSASTAGSTGNVARSQIDFGDGTVAGGASASHTYATVGTYLITATVYDAAGASSVAMQQISAQPSSGGINILMPGDGSTVNWPTELEASANPGTPVSVMRVLIDGNQVYAANGDTLDTALKVYTGSHQLTVQSLDSGGNVTASGSVTVIAEPTDVPPVAKITLKALPGISPTPVLGCTATSVGNLMSDQVQYSDGSQFTTPAALETFPAPGTYKATATVTDEFGAANSTSTTFSVGNGTVTAAQQQR